MDLNFKKQFISILVIAVIVSSIFGGITGFWAGNLAGNDFNALNWIKKVFFSGTDDNMSGAVGDLSAKKIIKIKSTPNWDNWSIVNKRTASEPRLIKIPKIPTNTNQKATIFVLMVSFGSCSC